MNRPAGRRRGSCPAARLRIRAVVVALLACGSARPPVALAADLDRAPFQEPGWRATERLARTPICDVSGSRRRISDDDYRSYRQREREILLARDAINRRDGAASRYLAVLQPGDFVHPCR